jgi:hypothetical protein
VQITVAWGEFIGGLALLIGLLTRLAAIGEMIIQAGAIYIVTWVQGFSSPSGGYEYNVSLLAMCLALVLLGGGTLSVDYLIARRGKKAAKQEPAPMAADRPAATATCLGCDKVTPAPAMSLARQRWTR